MRAPSLSCLLPPFAKNNPETIAQKSRRSLPPLAPATDAAHATGWQAPVEEAAEEAPAPAAEAPAPAAEAPAPAEEKPAEEEKPEEKVKEEVAKSPKKSPAKAKKEEPAADEPTVKKGRAKKEKKADAEDNGECPKNLARTALHAPPTTLV